MKYHHYLGINEARRITARIAARLRPPPMPGTTFTDVRRLAHTILVDEHPPAMRVAKLVADFDMAYFAAANDDHKATFDLPTPVGRSMTDPALQWEPVRVQIVELVKRGAGWVVIDSAEGRGGMAVKTPLWPFVTGQHCPATLAAVRTALILNAHRRADEAKLEQERIQSWHRAADRIDDPLDLDEG